MVSRTQYGSDHGDGCHTLTYNKKLIKASIIATIEKMLYGFPSINTSYAPVRAHIIETVAKAKPIGIFSSFHFIGFTRHVDQIVNSSCLNNVLDIIILLLVPPAKKRVKEEDLLELKPLRPMPGH